MMSLKIRQLAAFLFIGLAVSGCTAVDSWFGRKDELTISDAKPQADFFSAPVMATVANEPVVLFNTKAGHIALWRDGRVEELDGGLPVQGGKNLQLVDHDGKLVALWWNHDPAKTVYLRVSDDGDKTFSPTARIGKHHGILPPFSLAFGPDNLMALVHSDERITGGYQVYLSESRDGGKTWPVDIRLDEPVAGDATQSLSPHLVQWSPTHWAVVWREAKTNTIFSRVTEDAGKTWGPITKIYSDELPVDFLTVIHAGDGIFVAAQVGAKVGIKGFYSLDGVHWTDVGVLPGSENLSNSGLVAVASKTDVALLWNPFDPSAGRKPFVLAGIFNIKEKKWVGKAEEIDKKETNAMSLMPTVATTPEGVFVAAWLDFRTIRPNVYLSASFDHGKSWTKPQDVGVPGQYSMSYPALRTDGKKIWLMYEYFTDDSHKDAKIVVSSLHLEPGVGFKNMPSVSAVESKRTEALLRSRVEEFWNARIKKEWGKTYQFFDPAFRAEISKSYFVDRQGNIVYEKYKVDKIEIKGNVAEVTLDIRYSVLPVEILGYKYGAIPAKDFKVTNQWVWIYDNWYMVYKPPVGQQPLQF